MNKKELLDIFGKRFGDSFIPYFQSVKRVQRDFVFMVRGEKEEFVVLTGKTLPGKFQGDIIGEIGVESRNFTVKLAELTHKNLVQLKDIFPYLFPSTCGRRTSFGTGDRLGITTPAHIRAFQGKSVFPIVVQQSVRENTRTGRDFQKVMDDAIWGIFEAGYEGPFGADADHVKNIHHLKEAVDCGYTMFTVDPSDFVRGDIDRLSEKEKNRLYNLLPEKKELERRYLNKNYSIAGIKFHFNEKSLRDIVLTYFRALQHVKDSYEFLRSYKKGEFDFEISVDETPFPTSPLAHIFIVEELHRRGVDFQNLALHFIGDWQKGIDYVGDVGEFTRELSLQASIAKNFGGYKLSLHSGSDKFSVYPIFAKETKGLFHIKTAGTSFLEAIKVIARKNPSLYREIHRFALHRFEEDKLSYNVSTNLFRIPPLDEVPDDRLYYFLDQPDSRQLIHITYGSILTGKDRKGNHLFRDKIYQTLFKYEDDYYRQVTKHIKKHLELLEL